MKALTITQPWATLVAIGEKHFETRDWRPPLSLIGGRLAIHAGKTLGPVGGKRGLAALCNEWDDGIDDFGPYGRALFVDGPYAEPEHLPFGAVLCTATIERVVPTTSLDFDNPPEWATVGRDEAAFGNYGPDRWAWHLTDLRFPSRPIPAKGHQKIWEWTRS